MNEKKLFSRSILRIFLLKIFFFPLIIASANSQNQAKGFCASEIIHRQILRNGNARILEENLEQRIYSILDKKSGKNFSQLLAGKYVIPAVVHIVHDNGPENISDDAVREGIDTLNKILSNSGSYFRTLGVDLEIEIRLAKQDESGSFTNGITRAQSPLTDVIMEEQDFDLKKLRAWNSTKYLNIWLVREIHSSTRGDGVSGYAMYPSQHGSTRDGIVGEARDILRPEHGMKILAHEIGHYLGLLHTFEGDCRNNNCLKDGDRVCDTPPDGSTAAVPCEEFVNTCRSDEDDISANNPFRPVSAGGSGEQNDLTVNYMDYGDMKCQSLFTAGQKERMLGFLTTVRKSLLSSAGAESPCKKIISAKFSLSAKNILSGASVSFVNLTTGAANFSWKVNGKEFFTGIVPAPYTIYDQGRYIFSLVATNDDIACDSEYRDTVFVSCPVSAKISLNRRDILPGGSINLVNSSTGASGHEWFLDGKSLGNQNNFSYTFPNIGTYAISLIATNGICKDTAYAYIRVSTCISKQSNIWYFGKSNNTRKTSGLDFTNGEPVELTNSAIDSTRDGSAAICDQSGNLLFYTNGRKIFNRFHEEMERGLMATNSPAQAVLIVPSPGNNFQYYVFTVDSWENTLRNSVRYSIVDMRLNSGKGDVIPEKKNVSVINYPVTEALTGVAHCNGKDIWILVHKWNSSEFLAYLLTSGGLSAKPVISDIGEVHKQTNELGRTAAVHIMKTSHDGRKLAVGRNFFNYAELFDFNSATGEVTNVLTLKDIPAYGVEFSSDDSRLYFSALNGRSVYQYNMKADDIAASKILIAAPAPNGDQNGGALQLGPDGRIYYICSDNRIGIIKNPNALGKSCDYQDDEIILSSGKGWNGVPNIVQSALNNDKPTIVGRKSVCSNTSHTFVASPSCNESDIYEWKLSGHGKIESAAGSNVSIRFANVGSDTLVVNKTTTCGTTRDTSVISVTEPPIVDLGESVKICGGKMIVLDTKLPAEYTHIWQDGSKNSTLKVTSAGKYWFTASSPSGCTVSDTVIIESENNSPTVKLNPSQAKICRGSIVTLDAGEGYAEYSWPDGSHEQTFTAYGGGKYWVRVTDACGNISSDTAIVEETVEELITTKDTTICKGDTIMLSASGGDYYYWENHPSVISINDSTKLAAPSSTTNYRIAATMRSGCEKEGNITVSVDESSHYFRVSSENMSGLISEKNISIPVKIFSDAKSLPLTIRNLQVWLHYDAKSLITTKTSQGILKKNIFGGQENIYLYIADLDLTQAEQIVANLDAELFLGDSASVKVMFDSATAQSQKCITMSVEEAVVELGGCGLASREGLIVQSPVVSVAPNPAEENSYIYIRNITKGKYLLAIYNMQGEKIWMQEFSFSQSSGEKISLPLNNFSSGVYRIIAETPLGTQTVPLFIVK